MKKFGKISSIFELSISKLGHMEIFIKIRERHFWLICWTFFSNQGKNEDEDEKKLAKWFENFISSSARDSDRSLVIDQASMSHKSSYDFLQSIIHIPNLMASVDPEIRSILLF